ncbi:dash complex subunit duo1 [Malassezia pachydermatis]|uniref:DASH complex subunit DUO1 n=1 Tax=Malassezia pachydermatis TaxID=77020 RepID=A0A0M8MX66_9BASI|nr:dash complex subunit duo1 [Malassezia pachydermatis]KOS15620.1 dash complex subunit duo1 [Malassezia pachydermatis]
MSDTTPLAHRTLGDESTFDQSIGDTTSNVSLFHKGDDSLLSNVLLGHNDAASTLQALRTSQTEGESESVAQIQAQLNQLQKLNDVFESYEQALTGSLGQMETFSQKIRETDALLDTYLNLLTQAERRRMQLADQQWQGTTKEAEMLAVQKEEEQRKAAAAALKASRTTGMTASRSDRLHASTTRHSALPTRTGGHTRTTRAQAPTTSARTTSATGRTATGPRVGTSTPQAENRRAPTRPGSGIPVRGHPAR